MKNIKKILFSFILVCTFFCFSKNVLADTTCNYVADYPFDDSIIVSNPKIIYSQYIKYVYTVLLKHDVDDYMKFIEQRKNGNVIQGSTGFTNGIQSSVKSINATYNLNSNKITLTIYANGETIPSWYNKELIVSNDVNIIGSKCPDVITVSEPEYNYSLNGWRTFIGIFHSQGNMNNALYDALKSTESEHKPNLVLMSTESKAQLEMAAIYVYMGYYAINLARYKENINPIIEKYLKINGFEELLKEINLSLDTDGTINDETYQKVVSLITNQLSNNNMSINDVENDVNELKEFDNTISSGIFNALKGYVSPYGLTVSKWYDEYMPGSPSKYIRALLLILPVLNDDEIMQKVQMNKNLDDANRNYQQCLKDKHKLENCMSECQEFYKLSDCQDSSNISACIKAYPSNVCKGKNTSTVQTDIDKAKKEEEEKLKDLIGKKLTDIYSNYGINISESDKNAFCSILLGEGENDGLYPYIRLVLNLIRIAGPILVVLLTAFDGMKVITSFKGDENKKFWNHLKIRLICLVILILVPTIINYIVNLFIDSCPINV